MQRTVVVCMLMSVLAVQVVEAQIPETMSYQGLLTDAAGTPVADGDSYRLTFRLYESESGGPALWSEEHYPVAVKNGVFSVILGSVNALDTIFDKQYWLGITVGTGMELTPRVRLTSSAYSLGGNFWRLNGNAETDPDDPGKDNFLGTTDDNPLELRVNGLRVLRLESYTKGANFIGGFNSNSVKPSIYGATICGGGSASAPNRVDSYYATVGGGRGNIAAGEVATIGGGSGNEATGDYATVPGGLYNKAQGDYSFAAGQRAIADYGGCFVWGDASIAEELRAYGPNRFVVRSAGGTWFYSNAARTEGLRLPAGSSALSTVSNSSALELRLMGDRVLRLEPADDCENLIGGSSDNSVVSGVNGATISGGGGLTYLGDPGPNRVTDYYGTVGGGLQNQAGDDNGISGWDSPNGNYSTVGGGIGNTASGNGATISGGHSNIASGQEATVCGGYRNKAYAHQGTVCGGDLNVAGATDSPFTGRYATVGGGLDNTASGQNAMIPGGKSNRAEGSCSFAAGYYAKAEHNGSFVWSDRDSYGWGLSSETDNEFAVRCKGGARFVTEIDNYGVPTLWAELDPTTGAWSPAPSDRNFKANFTPADGRDVLERLVSIPIETWNYKTQDPSIRHIGPMAQDFYAAFGLGKDDKRISTVDADGVALAAIQALYELVKEKDARIADLEARLETLETLVSSLTQRQSEDMVDGVP